jgi:hypothetical protein
MSHHPDAEELSASQIFELEAELEDEVARRERETHTCGSCVEEARCLATGMRCAQLDAALLIPVRSERRDARDLSDPWNRFRSNPVRGPEVEIPETLRIVLERS